jgi:TolB-like protein/DNA-binding winged helix-turn-helix (wHTH) protein/Flp pilus assembly protein TadD
VIGVGTGTKPWFGASPHPPFPHPDARHTLGAMDWLPLGFRLGDCEVHPADGTVVNPKGTRRIGPRPMELLVYLARHPGRVFSRAELMQAIWGRVIVSDETLSRCISDLRQVLGEGAKDARYIETLPKRGYRLNIGPQELVQPHPSPQPPAEEASDAVPPIGPGAKGAKGTTEPTATTTEPSAASLLPQPPRRTFGAPSTVAIAAAAAMLVVAFAAWQLLPPRAPVPTTIAAASLAPNGIAVLPFANLSDDPNLEYFSDGLTEELLNALAAQHDLEVVARTSSFAFRKVDRDIREIGHLLGVANVLEGSVRREGERLRVTVQLIDANTGFHRFSKTYDRPLADLLDLQEQLALEVGATVAPRLADAAERDPMRRITSSPDALEAYLLGKHLQRKLNVESLAQAADRFREAIELDPGFAFAHAGLAETLALTSQYAELPIAQFSAEIEALVSHALALDPMNGSAWHARGLLAMYEGRLPDAAEAFATARKLPPHSVGSAAMHARTLYFMGDYHAALAITRDAVRRDPLSLLVINNHAMILRRIGEYAEAERWLLRSMEIDPLHHNAIWGIAYLKWITGDPQAGASWYQQGIDLGIRQSHIYSELAWVLLDLGRFDEAHYWIGLAFEKATDPLAHLDVRVAWHVSLGDLAGLMQTVEEFSERFPGHPEVALYRALAALHAGDATTAVREYEALAGLATDRLHSTRDMDFGYWHALLLARARQLAGDGRALALSLAEAERQLARYEREGGIPGIAAYYRAALALLRDEPDVALEALEAARQAGWRRHAHARFDPLLRQLWDDPRFEAVLAAVKADATGEQHAATH